jgi:FG-GAP-like repeat
VSEGCQPRSTRRRLVRPLVVIALAVVGAAIPATAIATPPDYDPAVNFATGDHPASLALVDLTGAATADDTRLDVVTANSASADGVDGVSVLLNTAATPTDPPTFAAPLEFDAGPMPSSVTAVDLNADGRHDLIVANKGSATGADGVSILLNHSVPGNLSLSGPFDFDAGANPASIAVGDINQDGKPDLVIANSGSASGVDAVSVLLNTTPTLGDTPSFAGPFDFDAGAGPASVVVGARLSELGDRQDIVTANTGSASGADGVSLLKNTTAVGASTPTFAAPLDFDTGPEPSAVELGNVNAGTPNRTDIAVTNGAGVAGHRVSVLLNTAVSGSDPVGFSQPPFDFDAGANPTALLGGLPDIYAQSGFNMAVADDSGVSVLVNETPGAATTPSFSGPFAFAAGAGPADVAAGDLNGDGPQEVLTANSASGGANGLSVLSHQFPADPQTSSPCFSDPGGASPTTQTSYSTTHHETDFDAEIADIEADSTRVTAHGPSGDLVYDETTPNPPASTQASALLDSASAALHQAYPDATVSGPTPTATSDARGPAVNLGFFRSITDTGTSVDTTFGPATILVGMDQSQSLFIPSGCTNTNTNSQYERFVARLLQHTTTHESGYELTATLAGNPPVPPAPPGAAQAVPDTEIVKAKVKAKKHKAKILFTATSSPTGFECALKKPKRKHHHGHHRKPKFKTCASPRKYKHLKVGKYTFQVRAFNDAGVDPTPAKKKFKSRAAG